jgi:hypothetical protein
MADEEKQLGEHESLERIREILFGARARDADARIGRLEARLASEIAAVRDELRRRFADLETHVRGEIEALSARIDEEAAARSDSASRAELRMNRLDEASARGQRELRRQILDMTRDLGAQVSRAREEMMSALDAQQAATREAPSEEQQPERASLH